MLLLPHPTRTRGPAAAGTAATGTAGTAGTADGILEFASRVRPGDQRAHHRGNVRIEEGLWQQAVEHRTDCGGRTHVR